MYKYFHTMLLVILLLSDAPSNASERSDESLKISIYDVCRSATGRGCQTQVLLKGAIDDNSAEDLNKLLEIEFPKKDYRKRNIEIVFDSPGGSLIGGIKLGTLIRQLGIRTQISETYNYYDEKKHGEKWEGETFLYEASCASACVLAYVGGKSRAVGGDSLIGVHQFYTESNSLGESGTQTMVAVVGNYLDAMGVNRKLLDLASLTSANSMLWLTKNQAIELGLDTSSPVPSKFEIKVSNTGDPFLQLQRDNFHIRVSNINGLANIFVLDGYSTQLGHEVPGKNEMQDAEISFCEGWTNCVKPTRTSGWTLIQKPSIVYLAATSTMSFDAFESLSNRKNIFYDDNKPMVASKFSKRFEISKVNLNSYIKLLRKAKNP